ncbi:MAG: serine protease [Verrucomicrobiota bacterium]|nr:serine protease [Verrucomicrobiota bacterium]MDQ6939834.1 serine protease [Verrucomicrobiota bacterium]
MKPLVFLSLLLVSPFAQASQTIHKGDVVVVPVQGEVSQPMFVFLRRVQKAAESEGASALILDMNTYGGQLDSAEEITHLLNQAKIPTYTFINTNAGSAGALIALATRNIYMAPVSAIGAAAPILSTGEDLPATAREKTISYWSALIRGSAIRNGHNPDIGEAFMNKEKEVKIGERVVHAKGSLLTLNAQEATEKIDGKPLLAADTVDSLSELAKKAALSGKVVMIEPTGFEKLAFWITAFAPLLLLGGIIGAYLEFKIPGASLPGFIAAICFALFFLGHYLAGLAGWEVVALFVLGVFFVLLEILFFAHSTIVVGVVGIFLMLGSLLWAMIDRYPGETFLPTAPMLRVPVLNLLIAMVASVIVIALLAKYLPRTSLYRRFVLSSNVPAGTSLSSIPRDFHRARDFAAGAQGEAVTTLRPSGKARFGESIVDVVTEGDFIPAQTAVAIVSSDGMRVVVKAVS